MTYLKTKSYDHLLDVLGQLGSDSQDRLIVVRFILKDHLKTKDMMSWDYLMTYFRINRINLKTIPVNFSPGIFIKIFQHCNDKAFLHNLAHISLEKLSGFCHRCIFRRGMSCWILEVICIRTPDTDSGFGPNSSWQSALFECSCLRQSSIIA